MMRFVKFWMLAIGLLGLSSLTLWNCNVSDTGDTYAINVKLNDSLAVEDSIFKTVTIDLYDGNGNLVQANVFHGAYHKSDAEKLAKLPLDAKPPEPFEIRITAYKDSNDYWIFKTSFSNGVPQTLPPVYHPGPDTNPESLPSRVVIVNPVSRTLYLGDSAIPLIAKVEPNNAPNAVTWSLSASDVAVIGIDGKLRALKAGTFLLKAASTGTPSIFDTATVTVKAQPTALPVSVQITNSRPLLLTVGGSSPVLNAVVQPSDASQNLVWSLLTTGIAVIESGNTIKGLTAGTVQVKAASAIAPMVFDTLTVTVQAAPSVMPTAIIPKAATLALQVGDPAVNLEATVIPAEASQSVFWSLEAAGVVEIVNNSQIRGLKAGTAKVIATSAIKASVTGTITVTVTAPVVNPDSISLRMPVPMTLAPGGATSDINWAVLPAGADQGVEWSSSDITVAQVTNDNKVKPLAIGKATITGKSKAKPTLAVTFQVNVVKPIKVDAITVTPKTLKLYTGGADGQLTVAMIGNDSGAQYSLSSSNTQTATVNAAGAVKGLKAGSAAITAAVVGYPEVSSICSVTVITDPPVVTLTPDQTVAYGGEATFSVSVTQAYGTVAEIKADLDGNGTFEKIALAKDTATFKASYAEAKIFNLSFEIKDSEGNVVALTRKVTVTAAEAPVVKIIDPATAITVNTTTYTVKFTVKDPTKAVDEAKDSVVTLVSGPNTIKVSRSNAGGVGSASVVITLDNTAPGTPVLAAQPASSNKSTLTWTWAAVTGAAKYQVRLDDPDFTKLTGTTDLTVLTYASGALPDGLHTLYVRAVDNLGNASTAASQAVTIDTKAPGVPTITAPTVAAVRAGPITWKWTAATPANGSGKFKVKINAGPEIDATLAEYTLAAAGMTDGTVYGLSVKETDPIAGDGPWSAEKKVLFDSKKPNPTISATATRAKIPEWKWESNGGVGTFRAHMKGQTPGSAVSEGPTKIYSPTNLAAGSYILCVQEKDSPEWGEEWGTENCAPAVVVDKTGPTVNIVAPATMGRVRRNIPVVSGDASDMDGIAKVEYSTGGGTWTPATLNAVAKTWSFTPTGLVYDQQYTISVRAYDSFDNLGPVATITLMLKQNVIFVRAGAISGNGASWETAYGTLDEALATAASPNEIWVTEGTYRTSGSSRWAIKNGVSIYGGFRDAGDQGTIASRTFDTDKSVMQSGFEAIGASVQNLAIDGFHFAFGSRFYIESSYKLKISNCRYTFTEATSDPFIHIASGSNEVEIRDVNITNNTNYWGAIKIDGYPTVDIYNTKITGDPSSGSVGIHFQPSGDNILTLHNITISGHTGLGQIYHNGGQLVIAGCTLTNVTSCGIEGGQNGIFVPQ